MNISTIISIGISIISVIFCISTFVRNGNKDTKKETADDSYKQGQLDAQLKQIFEKLDKIEAKLDSYDKEIDTKVKEQINLHIQLYHKGEKI